MQNHSVDENDGSRRVRANMRGTGESETLQDTGTLHLKQKCIHST